MALSLETLTSALQQLAENSPEDLETVIKSSCGDLYVPREKYNRLKVAYTDAKTRLSAARANRGGSTIQSRNSRRLTTGTANERRLLRTSSDSGHYNTVNGNNYGQSSVVLGSSTSARRSCTLREANNRLLPHIRPWTLVTGTPFLPPGSPEVALAGERPESPRAVQTLRMIVIAQSAVRGWLVRRNQPSLPLARVTHEVVSSERRYVDALKTCVEVWMRSFRRRPESTDEMGRVIFLQLEAIYLLQQTVLHALESTWVPYLSGYRRPVEYVLHKYSNSFRSYKAYVDGYANAITMINTLQNQHAWFREWREKCKAVSNNEDLDSFLIRPIQRLPRYVLFLRQLEHVAESAPVSAQLPDMTPARESMETVLQFVNRQGYHNPLALLPCSPVRLYQTITFPVQRVTRAGVVQRHAARSGELVRNEHVYVLSASLAVVVDGTIVEAYAARDVRRCGQVSPEVDVANGKNGFWFVDTSTTYMLFFSDPGQNLDAWLDAICNLVHRD